MASHYLRGDIWYLGWRENGEPHCKSTRSKDEKVAKYMQNELENRLARGHSPLPDTDRSALAILEEYKQASVEAKKTKTINNDHSRLKRYFTESKIFRLNQVTESSLSRYIAGKIKTADRKDGLEPSSCNAIIKNAKTFLGWARRNNYVGDVSIQEIPRYKEPKKHPRFFSKDEIKAILIAADEVGIGIFARVALYTGMRFGELSRLTWGDFNFDRDDVTVQESKTGESRTIPLHPELKKVLIPARRKTQERCFELPTNPHTAYKLYLRRLERVCSIAKVNDVDGWHTFRHTFASQLVMAGVDLVSVSKMMGHSKIDMTMRYSHLSQGHAKEGIGKLSF